MRRLTKDEAKAIFKQTEFSQVDWQIEKVTKTISKLHIDIEDEKGNIDMFTLNILHKHFDFHAPKPNSKLSNYVNASSRITVNRLQTV